MEILPSTTVFICLNAPNTGQERGASKGKEGSIKIKKSFYPSKVANEWGNIPFSIAVFANFQPKLITAVFKRILTSLDFLRQ